MDGRSRFASLRVWPHLGAALKGHPRFWGVAVALAAAACFATTWGLVARSQSPLPSLKLPQFIKRVPGIQPRQMVRTPSSLKTRTTRPAPPRIRGARPRVHLASARVPLRRADLMVSPFLKTEIAAADLNERGPPTRVVTEEMLDIDALDTGRHHAMVIQDPADKRNITGFLHIAPVGPVRGGHRSSGVGGGSPGVFPAIDVETPPARAREWEPGTAMYNRASRYLPGIQRLARLGMNRFTSIRTDVLPPVPLDSDQILRVPWLFMPDLWRFSVGAARPLEDALTDYERENLGAYLMQGGFLHTDGFPPRVSYEYESGGSRVLREPGYVSVLHLRQMIIDALDTQGIGNGRDWRFERLPNSHRLYHCHFDFDGPPVSASGPSTGDPTAPSLEGVIVERRLLAIVGQMGYLTVWSNWGVGDPTRILQFGVNSIVFALTQEGSITSRVMDTVSY